MQLCDAELKRDSRVPKEVASPRGRPARGVSGALRVPRTFAKVQLAVHSDRSCHDVPQPPLADPHRERVLVHAQRRRLSWRHDSFYFFVGFLPSKGHRLRRRVRESVQRVKACVAHSLAAGGDEVSRQHARSPAVDAALQEGRGRLPHPCRPTSVRRSTCEAAAHTIAARVHCRCRSQPAVPTPAGKHRQQRGRRL
eukprot:scaffold77322_cov58-Phaeocystis_antarctica.AAC.10